MFYYFRKMNQGFDFFFRWSYRFFYAAALFQGFFMGFVTGVFEDGNIEAVVVQL
ncbi:MAG: hypothetical protein V5A64_02555 [Candidatus Thermoplasmatota archaeon]